MIQGFDNAKTLPACDALVGCVIAADHGRLRISIHCVFYASGEKVARFGAIEILPTYTPEAGCPRRGFEPRIRTIKTGNPARILGLALRKPNQKVTASLFA